MQTMPPPPPPLHTPPDPGVDQRADQPAIESAAEAIATRRLSRRARAIGLVAMVATIVAIASAAGGLGHNRQGEAKRSELLSRVGGGAVAGLVLGVLLVALLHAINPKHRATQHFLYGGGDRKFRTALKRSFPAIALLVALGALIGSVLTPLYPKSNNLPDQSSASNSNGGSPRGRITDRNGDGKGEVEIDADGDGIYEGYYVPCEGQRLPGGPLREGDGAAEGKIRVAVDRDCDGDIDYYTEIRLDQIGRPETAPGQTIDKNGKVTRTNKSGTPKTKTTKPPKPGQTTTTTIPKDPNKRPGSLNLPTWLGWLLVGLLAAAVIGSLVWGYIKRNKKLDQPGDEVSVDTDIMAASVAESVDLAENDPDPRKAIIASYGRLLEGLAVAGTPRRLEEGPEEFLDRSLAALSLRREPFQELTRLFALARFSQHPVTEGHRSQALDALGAVRRELDHLREPVAVP
jgi:Domain of unknown function (DUF4129)